MACRRLYLLCFVLINIFISQNLLAQRNKNKIPVVEEENISPGFPGRVLLNIGDSFYIIKGICKNNWTVMYPSKQVVPVVIIPAIVPPFLKVHGNIYYNFSYRSYIDTPFAQNDLQQNLVRTTLSFVIENMYPVQMTITNRSSNSPYFKNLTDVNFNFNRRYLLDNIKEELKQKSLGLRKQDILKTAGEIYLKHLQQAKELKHWINSPARAQEFVEEKERTLNVAASNINTNPIVKTNNTTLINQPGLNNLETSSFLQETTGIQGINWEGLKELKPDMITDTVLNKALREEKLNTIKDTVQKLPESKDSSLINKYNVKKQELKKLLLQISQDEAKLKQLKKNNQDSINAIKKDLAALTTNKELFAFMKNNGIAKSELTKAQRLLLSINQVGIGRTWIDYSELTVKNISLAGVNVEINPAPFYFAFAAGKVNYAFRDFIFKNNVNKLPDQSLYIIRAGISQKEKNSFIISFYNGKKASLNYTPSNTAASMQQVLGISVEEKFAFNRNNYIVAEVAKSSFNNNAGTQPATGNLIGKTFDFKIHTNEAYSIKLYSQTANTNTKLSAYYKKMGENFQSFNLFPVNINQDAWMVKADQYFWKKRFTLDAAVRKNDFISPIAAPSLANTTIFKSLQASFRMPKYPFVSIGYFPSSQLSLSNNNFLMESQYNTVNAIISHNYQFKKTGLNTNAVFTKFYNNSSDTGFIYFNASSFTVNQSAFLGKFTVQSSAALTDQKDLHLFTYEQMLSYQFKNKFSFGGSLKWNKLNKTENLFGGSGMMNINISRLGTLQFNYEKTFLPGYNRVLKPVDIGRMGFSREF